LHPGGGDRRHLCRRGRGDRGHDGGGGGTGLGAGDEPLAVTAVTACVVKAAAFAGMAAAATEATWAIRFAAEFVGRLPMLFCTMFDTVVMAVCTTPANAGLLATSCASGPAPRPGRRWCSP